MGTKAPEKDKSWEFSKKNQKFLGSFRQRLQIPQLLMVRSPRQSKLINKKKQHILLHRQPKSVFGGSWNSLPEDSAF